MDTYRILGQRGPQKQTSDDEVNDLLELNKLFAKIEAIDLSKVEAEVIERRTPLEGVIEALRKNEKAISRKKTKPKQHWKMTKRKRREYHLRVRKPKQQLAMAEAMAVDGWWPRLKHQWQKAYVEVVLTKDEWNEHIVPVLGDGVPMISRYNPKEPISIENIWITCKVSGKVVFDGKEHSLRKSGYIL